MMDGMGDCNALAVAPNTGYAKGPPALGNRILLGKDLE